MPVTLADIRARVLDDLRRGDVTTAQLDRWIADSVRRIQRTLHTPIDEAVSSAVIPAGFAGAINVPANLLTPISIQVDGVELTMRAITEVKRLQSVSGARQPIMYAREAGQYLIAPLPPVGATVLIHYRADFATPVAATDSLKLFDVAADVVAAGALISAGIWAKDKELTAIKNDEYNVRLLELQDMANRAELLNASIQPAYDFSGGFRY